MRCPLEDLCARFDLVDVVLRKLGRKLREGASKRSRAPGASNPASGSNNLSSGQSRAVVGRLARAPRRGAVIVVEFADGLHEYVTTPVKRIFRIAGNAQRNDGDVYYIETSNSRYRMEVRAAEAVERPEAARRRS